MSGKNPDEMFCESCGEAIKQIAEVCPHCGVRNQSTGASAGSGATVGTSNSGGGDPHDDGIFEFALKYPMSNDLGPLVFGSLMMLLSVFVLPMLALYGYAYRVGRAAARGDDSVPDFDDWGALMKNGLLYVVALLPFTIALMVGFAALFGIASQLDPGPVLYGLVLVGGLLLLVASYVGGAIVPTFVATGSVTETYKDLRFVKIAFSKDFLVGFLVLMVLNSIISTAVSVVVMVLFFSVVGILLLIPLSIGFLPLSVYLTYLTTALWGYVAWDSSGEAPFPHVGSQDSLDAEF